MPHDTTKTALEVAIRPIYQINNSPSRLYSIELHPSVIPVLLIIIFIYLSIFAKASLHFEALFLLLSSYFYFSTCSKMLDFICGYLLFSLHKLSLGSHLNFPCCQPTTMTPTWGSEMKRVAESHEKLFKLHLVLLQILI